MNATQIESKFKKPALVTPCLVRPNDEPSYPPPARWPNSKGFSPRPTRPSSITAAAASPLYRIPTNLCYFLSSLGLGRHCRVDGKRGIRGEEGSKRGIQPTHSAISGRVVSGGLWTLPQIGDRREGNEGKAREGKR